MRFVRPRSASKLSESKTLLDDKLATRNSCAAEQLPRGRNRKLITSRNL